jgi:hypothetical protein
MVMSPSLIESVPEAELSNGPRPRVLSDSPAAKRARDLRARRKEGLPTGKPGRPRKAAQRSRTPRTPKSLYPEIAALFTMANTLVTMTPLGSKYEPTGTITQFEIQPGMSVPIPEMRQVTLGDELDEMEIAHLAKAIDAQCQRSPRFKRYVEMVLGVGAGGGIIAIVGIIAARRAARHGIIDRSLDPKLGMMLNGDLSALSSFVPSAGIDETPDHESGEQPPIPGSGGDADEADPRDFKYE